MSSSDGGMLWFGAGLDTTQLARDANKASQTLQGIGNAADVEGSRIENMAKNAALAIGGIFTAQAASQLVSRIIDVTGQFQQLNVAFTTILQSKEKADALMSQMVTLATTTPFQLGEVANGAKQLIAYGFASETVNDTLKRLGNIASGLGLPLERLTYLYGTTMTQGRLYTRDLLQFTTSGIPMLQGLETVFHKTSEEIMKMVQEGKIGFPEVQKVIEQMTNSGGKFYNLMPEMSKTVTGQISNLKDSITVMLNDIGKANLGIINTSISSLGSLVSNYKEVGKTIAELVGAYGIYKATIITATALEKAWVAVKAWRDLALATEIAETGTLATVQGVLAVSEGRLIAVQNALNVAIAKNPYVLIGAAVAGLAYEIYKLSTATTILEDAQNKYKKTIEDANAQIVQENVKIYDLFSALNAAKKGTNEYVAAKKAIMDTYGNYLKGLGDEKTALNNVAKAYDAITAASRKATYTQAINASISQAQSDYTKQTEDLLKQIKDELDKKFGKNSTKSLDAFWALQPNVLAGMGEKSANPAFLEEFQQHHVVSPMFPDAKAVDEANNKLKILLEKTKETYDAYHKVKDEAEKVAASEKINLTPTTTPTTTPPTTGGDESGSSDAKTAKTIAEAAARLKKESEDIEHKKEDYQNEATQSYINTLADGREKEIAQRDLDHKIKLQAIDREEQELLDKQREYAMKQWEDKGSKGTFDPNSVQLSQADKSNFASMRANEDWNYYQTQGKELQDLLEKYQTYSQKRLAIESDAAEKLKILQSKNTHGEFDQQIAIFKKQTADELQAADIEFANSQTSYKSWVDTITNMALGELQSQLMSAQVSLSTADILKGTNPDALSAEDRATLVAKIKALQDQIAKLQNENSKKTAKASDPTANNTQWIATVKTMEAVDSSVKEIISDFSGLNEGTKQILSSVANVTGGVMKMFDAIGKLQKDTTAAITDVAQTGADGVKKTAIAANDATKAAATALSTAEKASLILTVISAGVQVIMAIVGIFTSHSQKMQEELKKEHDAQVEEYLGLIKYNEELEKKYEWTKKIGEATLDYLQREGAEIAKQAASSQVDQESLLEKLRWSEWVKNGGLTSNPKYSFTDSLKMTYEDFAKLASEGKLSEDGKKYFEALKSAKEQGDELATKQEEYLQKVKETYTGTTYDSIVNSIVDGFKAGKKSAADFADTFQNLMQQAVLASLKLETDQKVQSWYDEFAKFSQAGLTADEIAQLQKDFNDAMQSTATDAANLQKITGVSLTDTAAARTGTAKGIATASQASVDENNGLLTNMEGHTYTIVNDFKAMISISNQMLANLIGINSNTASMDGRLSSIEVDMGSIKQGINDINTKGIILKR
jgi:molybdopterin converting factor small subunit